MRITLRRRGFELGSIDSRDFGAAAAVADWHQGKAIYLPAICQQALSAQRDNIAQSARLYRALLQHQESDQILAAPPYSERLQGHFEALGSSVNPADGQEIETLMFDAVQEGSMVAEDLWLKISWLSFCEQDTSLRFRFSFGEDFVEDVAADPLRQHYAAQLAQLIFPESDVITKNYELNRELQQVLDTDCLNFVERIVYFNSPQGGAYLHHDRERGHAGVVYAQLTGKTFWLAVPAVALLQEIASFVKSCQQSGHWPASVSGEQQQQLLEMTGDSGDLAEQLHGFDNSALIHLINETEPFVQRLISAGYGQLLFPGDALLLPQQDAELCCWHSVFCLDQSAGQALSFAVRTG